MGDDESSADLMYRYEDVAYAAPFDDTGRLPGTVKVELRTYKIVRRTDKGTWIAGCFKDSSGMIVIGAKRFVLLTARKRFACPTLDEARASFVARKQKQVRIYKARIERAIWALAEIKRMEQEPKRGNI